MNYLDNKNPVDIMILLCDNNNITAYEIEKATGLNASGVQRILNKKVKKPRSETLKKIFDYIEERITATELHNKETDTSLLKEPNSKYIPIKTNR